MYTHTAHAFIHICLCLAARLHGSWTYARNAVRSVRYARCVLVSVCLCAKESRETIVSHSTLINCALVCYYMHIFCVHIPACERALLWLPPAACAARTR